MSIGDDDFDSISRLCGEDGEAIAHFPTPTWSTISYSDRYLRTWCGSCGRKRGRDGRCAECDGWWTAPLLMYGAPVIVLTTTLLLLVIPLLRPQSDVNTFKRVDRPIARRVPMRATRTVAAYPSVRPQFTVPAPPIQRPVMPNLPPSTPSADAVLLAQQARLRSLTEYAGAAEVRSEAARTWKGAIFVVPHAAAPSAVAPIPVPREALPAAAMSPAIQPVGGTETEPR